MELEYKDYALDAARVEEVSAWVQDCLSAQKMERRSVQRMTLMS